MNVHPCQPVDLSTLSTCQPFRPCQPVNPVDLSALSTCQPCRAVDLSTMSTLSTCRPCRPVNSVDLSTLSTCRPVNLSTLSTCHVRILKIVRSGKWMIVLIMFGLLLMYAILIHNVCHIYI